MANLESSMDGIYFQLTRLGQFQVRLDTNLEKKKRLGNISLGSD